MQRYNQEVRSASVVWGWGGVVQAGIPSAMTAHPSCFILSGHREDTSQGSAMVMNSFQPGVVPLQPQGQRDSAGGGVGNPFSKLYPQPLSSWRLARGSAVGQALLCRLPQGVSQPEETDLKV